MVAHNLRLASSLLYLLQVSLDRFVCIARKRKGGIENSLAGGNGSELLATQENCTNSKVVSSTDLFLFLSKELVKNEITGSKFLSCSLSFSKALSGASCLPKKGS